MSPRPATAAPDRPSRLLPRLAASLLVGAVFGALTMLTRLASQPSNALGDWLIARIGVAHHALGVVSRIGGWAWGWVSVAILWGCLITWADRRAGRSAVRGWLTASGAVFVLLVGGLLAATGVDVAVSRAGSGLLRLDLAHLGVWLGAAVLAAPVVGALAWAASSTHWWGTAARVFVPLSAVGEVLVIPPAATGLNAYALRALVACVLMIALGLVGAIIALALGPRAGATPAPVAAETDSTPEAVPAPATSLARERMVSTPLTTIAA